MKHKITYILICKTIPEYSKRDGTLYTCSIGLSNKFGLIRVYPLPPTGMDKYGIYEIEVEKNKKDTRFESWKLSSYSRKENWIGFSDDVKKVGVSNENYVSDYLSNYTSVSISELNKNRKSIGVIKTDNSNAFWDKNDRYINELQYGLFQDVGVDVANWTKFTKDSKEKNLRLKFQDQDGFHNLQYNEWHYYEGQRLYGATKEILKPLNKKDRNIILLGNMLQFRNNWIGLGKFKNTHKSLRLF